MGGSAVWLASLALCLSATGGQEVAEQVPEEKGYDVEGQIKLPREGFALVLCVPVALCV